MMHSRQKTWPSLQQTGAEDLSHNEPEPDDPAAPPVMRVKHNSH
jgi:hypothetical protein